MSSPYFHKSLVELRGVFEENLADLPILRQIAGELSRRFQKKPRSAVKLLLDEVLAKIEFIGTLNTGSKRSTNSAPKVRSRSFDRQSRSSELFGIETEAYGPLPDDREPPDRLTLIRPPGTPGLPDPYIRPRKQEVSLNLPDNADIPTRFAAALRELIREIKRTGAGQSRYELEKGMRTEVTSEGCLYAFPFSGEAELFEDAQIEIQVEGTRTPGTIVSIEMGRLVLAISEDLGSTIRSAVLLIDATALLKALVDKIEKVAKGEISLNRTLADAIVTKPFRSPDTAHTIPPSAEVDLNQSQREVYRIALHDAITFMWGPPGCGKTKTLGSIVRSAFEAGKRVLVCSNTNKAVDQVLYHICQAFGRQHPAMEEGRVVRLGKVVDDDLKSEYELYVTIEGIVERRSVSLNAERVGLEENVTRLDAKTEKARLILSRFELLDKAERQVAVEQAATNQVAREGQNAEENLARNKNVHIELVAEMEKRRTAFLRFMLRREETIAADLEKNSTARNSLELQLRDIQER